MHKEFAVEPAAIGRSWETFRYVFEKFGFSEGRLISRFPRHWQREVLEAAKAADVPDRAYKTIVEKLNARKTSLLKSGRPYDPDIGWVPNAAREQVDRPFSGIIVANDSTGASQLSVDELEDDHPLMRVSRTANIPRTADAICAACSMLLLTAKEIDLVDPYLFRIENRNSGFRETIAGILRMLADIGENNRIIRLHYGNANGCPTEAHVFANAGRWFRGLIPDTFTLHFMAWDEIPGGEDFHDRFVLTDLGGLQIGSGLAATGANETALVTLLDDGHAKELRSRFLPGGTAYVPAFRGVEISSDGSVRLI